MSQKTVSKDFHSSIEDWILNFLSKPNDVFAKFPPCPFAKRAWLDDKVIVHKILPWNIEDALRWTLSYFPPDKDVVLFCMDPKLISADYLSRLAVSTEHYIILDDHPDEPEEVGGVLLNQGTYAILFVQRRSELEQARKELAGTDYYKNFTQEYKDEVWQSRSS